ncbi:MAG: hypothetical protein AAF492_01890, partial [Verrucomicrobiota bacterium]
FRITDRHADNVVVHDRQPYLTDLQTSFRSAVVGRANVDLEDRGLAEFETGGAVPDFDPEKRKRVLRNLAFNKRQGRNRLIDEAGRTVRKDRYPEALERGYDVTMALFKSRKQVFSGLLDQKPYHDAVARALPMATERMKNFHDWMYVKNCAYFSEAIEGLEDPDRKIDALAGAPEQHLSKLFKAQIDHAVNRLADPSTSEEREPEYPVHFPAHAPMDVFEGEVPSFYHRVCERDLLNARGRPVVIPGVDGERRPDVSGGGPYFSESAVEAIRDYLKKL